eukprot:TRINITY_DN25267_c0_g1_i1.p1 TRINITY_DN25267_c0_g1~~TRINITY_DN25267_c0_g1_i1.p1  ORF type:complete len:276 (-),score=49.42 TRINITY_DN25267_c0_g1_i1:10-816(-)
MLAELLADMLVSKFETDDDDDDEFVKPPEHFGIPSAAGQAFFHLSQFPSLVELVKHWEEVRAEAVDVWKRCPVLDVLRPGEAWVEKKLMQEFVAQIDKQEGWFLSPDAHTDDPNPNWLNYGLIHERRPLTANARNCPTTLRLLSKLPVRVAGYSLLKPHTVLPLHRDGTGLGYGSLAFHLGLLVPEGGKCVLTANGVSVAEADGRPVIFDSTYQHMACNDSDHDRIILYMDFEVAVCRDTGLVHDKLFQLVPCSSAREQDATATEELS